MRYYLYFFSTSRHEWIAQGSIDSSNFHSPEKAKRYYAMKWGVQYSNVKVTTEPMRTK